MVLFNRESIFWISSFYFKKQSLLSIIFLELNSISFGIHPPLVIKYYLLGHNILNKASSFENILTFLPLIFWFIERSLKSYQYLYNFMCRVSPFYILRKISVISTSYLHLSILCRNKTKYLISESCTFVVCSVIFPGYMDGELIKKSDSKAQILKKWKHYKVSGVTKKKTRKNYRKNLIYRFWWSHDSRAQKRIKQFPRCRS